MLPLENLTVGSLLERTALRFPERPAMEFRQQVWTYREFDQTVDRVARRLLALGIKKGDHLAIWCEAEPNNIFLFYAAARIGAVVVMLNTSLGRPELLNLLRWTDVSWLAIGDGYKDRDYPELCRGLAEEFPALKAVLYIGLQGRGDGYTSLDGLLASESALEEARNSVYPEDTVCILYTSGTTSHPKAVMGSHYSRTNSGIQQAHDLGATEEDRFCVAMPTFHCFCLSVNIMAACASGACLYLPESRRTASLLEAISTKHCTIMSSVPALFHAMLSRSDFASWDISTLRTGFIGGSIYPPELFKEIENAFQFTLLSSLGQTEATAGITTTTSRDSLETRATTVGHFMDHVDGRIIDPRTEQVRPLHISGEICVRGYVVMQGYYGQSDETAKVIDKDGWLHTGDLGYLDDDGNIHLTGRLKELIIRGGENISPAEIEAVLARDARVHTCKAVGVPDSHYGEEICLCVVPSDAGCTREELLTVLREELADFKVPRYILFVKEIPATATGKVRLQELRKLAETAIKRHQF